MAGSAVLGDRGMLMRERAGFVGMTFVAGLVDGLFFKVAVHAAVRVMAAVTGHLAFLYRVMGGKAHFGILALMALVAGLGGALLEALRTIAIVHAVAGIAGKALGRVRAGVPEHDIFLVVAGEAGSGGSGTLELGRVLDGGETGIGLVAGCGRMKRTRAMTGLAGLVGFDAFNDGHLLAVQRSVKARCLFRMAGCAGFGPDQSRSLLGGSPIIRNGNDRNRCRYPN